MHSERGSSLKQLLEGIGRMSSKSCWRPLYSESLYSLVGRGHVDGLYIARVWVHRVARPEHYALFLGPEYACLAGPKQAPKVEKIGTYGGSTSIPSLKHQIVPESRIAASSTSRSVMFLMTHDTPGIVHVFYLNLSQSALCKQPDDLLGGWIFPSCWQKWVVGTRAGV